MQILLAVGVTLLTATVPQPVQALAPATPITITFVKASFEDAISAIAQVSGVTIEIDQSVSEQVRRASVADYALTMRGVTLEEALELLTSQKGLTYSIADTRTVRIFKKV
jgi:type II secretory pathway component GspD/PulD (secretin)